MTNLIWSHLVFKFAGIWELIWYFGAGGVVVIVCVAIWLLQPAFLIKFFPRIGNLSLIVAVAVAAAMTSSAIGVYLGEQRIQAQWDVARSQAVTRGKRARAGAIADVARKPSRWMPNHRIDPYDRDGH